jgi:hypothetical protein
MDPVPTEPWSHNLHYHRVVLGAIPGGRRNALDVGCGTGALTRSLMSAIPQVTGIPATYRLATTHDLPADAPAGRAATAGRSIRAPLVLAILTDLGQALQAGRLASAFAPGVRRRPPRADPEADRARGSLPCRG